MNVAEFLQDLSQQNVELFINGERLRYRGSKEVLTPTLLEQIKQHKPEIIELLR
ncbi:TubC N-terminal docking domain-related protein [Anabaena azotica]|uniref:TubC N-terminal docking domain-containing protein n=1 Tax=Anabaena azotica FACHB-119 TaxID=947527 RepID=A0ABR8D8D4_9NOST|nr:hypothetical protein [Anabaena azotica]MBD2502811.1 hypothetical protein [Anabaena azotica FACHB-119]